MIKSKKLSKNVKQEYDINSALLWEMVEIKTRETSLEYSSAKKANLPRHEQDLE